MRFPLLLFVTIPVLEMYILIQVGSRIGALPTIGLVLLTAMIGLALLKQQGLATLHELQSRLDRGEIPGQQLLEGIMLLIGGALLLTPGFVTDAIGFTCLLPGLRKPIARYLIARGILGAVRFGGMHSQQYRHQNSQGDSNVIDGEFEEQPNPHTRLEPDKENDRK